MARRTKYTAEVRGLREIARSAAMSQVSMDGARRIADRARSDNPRGQYSVTPTTVTAGWRNEARAGAQVVEDKPGNGPGRRSLARAVQEAGR